MALCAPILATVLGLLPAACGPAVALGSSGGQSTPSPAVQVRTVESTAILGALDEFTLASGLRLIENGERRFVPSDDLIEIAFATHGPDSTHTRPAATTLWMTNGDILIGQMAEPTGETLVIESAALGAVPVPLELVRRLKTAHAAAPGLRDLLEWFDNSQTRDADSLLLTNGDVVTGFLRSVRPADVVVETRSGDICVPTRLVVAIRFSNPGLASSADKHVRIRLRDGTSITLTDLAIDQDQVRGLASTGSRVSFETAHIEVMHVFGGRWSWLSSHLPISVQTTPMLALEWEPRHNRNVLGGNLRVGGRTFEYGIGVHSRSSLVFDLKGIYTEFVTHLGLDDSAGAFGDVTARILVDGQVRYEQAHIRAGPLLGPIRIDVARANRIELLVDFGDNGEMQDRFNWIEPGLIR